MDKVIRIEMCHNRSIQISVNGSILHVIEQGNRSIDANTLYSIFSSVPGDRYTVESVNDVGDDAQVLSLFEELLSGIANRVNQIKYSSDGNP